MKSEFSQKTGVIWYDMQSRFLWTPHFSQEP